MSYTCSPEGEAGFLLASCLGIDASEPSRSSHTHNKSCLPGSETASCHGSRCSATSEPLMLDPTEDELTSWLEAFPARTSASQAKAPASTATDPGSGWKWAASFAKWTPSSSTWRTRQCSLVEDSTEFLETWPAWGLMLDGECLEHTTPALAMSEKGCGFWPTPTRRDSRTLKGSQPPKRAPTSGLPLVWTIALTLTPEKRSAGRLNPEWVEWLMGWPMGWTDLRPLEMARFREWLQQHGAS